MASRHGSSVAPLLALGAAEFRNKNYGEALKAFERALREDPRGAVANDARLGIAACHYRVGNAARVSFIYFV